MCLGWKSITPTILLQRYKCHPSYIYSFRRSRKRHWLDQRQSCLTQFGSYNASCTHSIPWTLPPLICLFQVMSTLWLDVVLLHSLTFYTGMIERPPESVTRDSGWRSHTMHHTGLRDDRQMQLGSMVLNDSCDMQKATKDSLIPLLKLRAKPHQLTRHTKQAKRQSTCCSRIPRKTQSTNAARNVCHSPVYSRKTTSKGN